MDTRRTIPLNPQFFEWLAREIPQIQQGSIHLEIERGQLITIACHGHRFFHTPEELSALTESVKAKEPKP